MLVFRLAVRSELQKIAAARIRHGGGARARRKRERKFVDYEYAERYSDVCKYMYSDDPNLEGAILVPAFPSACRNCTPPWAECVAIFGADEDNMDMMLQEILGMSPNAAGNVP